MLRTIAALHAESPQRLAELSCGHRVPADSLATVGVDHDCAACDALQMPVHFVAYKETPLFTERTVPAALLRDHSTKRGVWAQILVQEGCLGYRVDALQQSWELRPGTPGIIAPEIPHAVSLCGAVSFFVRFFRAPSPSP